MGISRNEPCLCGSGMKYKKCCMKKSVVSLDNIRDVQLNKLQHELMDFAIYQHEDFIYGLVDEALSHHPEVESDEEEVLAFYLTMWIIFTVPYDDEETIIEQFIRQKKREKKVRPQVITQLEAWMKTAPSYSVVTKIIDDFHLEVEDVLTNERKMVKLLEKDEELEVGGAILGFLLPYGQYDIYFTMFIDFEADETPAMVEEIREHFKDSEFDHAEDFMKNVFPGLLLAIFWGHLGEDPDIEQLEWQTPKHEEVSILYRKQLEEEGLPKQFQDLGVMFWYLYCMKENPTFRKSEIYVAALRYFVDQNIPFLQLYTKGELADMYDISVASLSKACRQLENGLQEEIYRFHEHLEQDELAFDEEDLEDEIDLEEILLEVNELSSHKKRK